MTRFLDEPGPIAFAHRGFSPPGSGVAENSLAAFQRAVDLGYRYLETDARVTADGVALAFHDDALDRVTDHRGRLADVPWREVRSARIGGREPIPRLADVLAAWPDVFVNIDVKSAAALEPALAAVRAAGATDRVCLGAFSDRRIARIRRRVGPGVCTALGPGEAARLRLTGRARVRGARVAQLPYRLGPLAVVDRRLVRAAHRRGLPVHVWTVNDAAAMRALLDLGVDGIMTDRADLLRDVLRERGAWPTR